jgi:hypothetical protein
MVRCELDGIAARPVMCDTKSIACCPQLMGRRMREDDEQRSLDIYV